MCQFVNIFELYLLFASFLISVFIGVYSALFICSKVSKMIIKVKNKLFKR